MSIPDITQLVLLYAICIEYKFIKPIKKMLTRNKINISNIMETNPSICQNPHAHKYIKSPSCQKMIYMRYIANNPEPKIYKLLFDWLDSNQTTDFKNYIVQLTPKNNNPQFWETFIDKYGFSPTNKQIFYDLAACSSDKVTRLCISSEHTNPSKIMSSGLNFNTCQIAINYILNNLDLFTKSISDRFRYYGDLAFNTHPIILNMIEYELKKYIEHDPTILTDTTILTRINTPRYYFSETISKLSRNTSSQAYNIIKNYPQFINYLYILEFNANYDAIQLVIPYISKITNNYIMIMESHPFNKNIRNQIPLQDVLKNNTNNQFIYMCLEHVERTEGLGFRTINDLANPAFFKGTNRKNMKKVKRIINILESPARPEKIEKQIKTTKKFICILL